MPVIATSGRAAVPGLPPQDPIAARDALAEDELGEVARLVVELCDVPMVVVARYEDQRPAVLAAVGLDSRMEAAGMLSAFGRPFHGSGAGSPVSVLPVVDGEPASLPPVLADRLVPVRFGLAVPVVSLEGAVVGLIAIFDIRPRTLSDKSLAALHHAARQVDTLLVQSRQRLLQVEMEAERKRAAKAQQMRDGVLALLQDISSAELEMPELMALMARRTLALMKSSGAEVDLRDGDELVCHGAAGPTSRGVGFRIGLGNLSGQAMETASVQYSLNTFGDERVDQAIAFELGVGSMIVAPLLVRQQAIGVVRLSYDRAHAFSELEMANLQMLCTAVAGFIERKRIAEQQRTSEQKYRRLFQKNPHPLWVYEPVSLRFLAVNDAAVHLFGYDEAAFQQLRLSDLWSADIDAEAELRLVHAMPLDARTEGLRRRFRCRDGRVVDVEISGEGIDFEGRQARLLMVVDISARIEAEREVVRFARAQRMLSECNEALLKAGDRLAFLDQICRIAVGVGGYLVAWVAFAQDDAQKSVRMVSLAGELSEQLRDLPLSWDENLPIGRGTVGRAIRTGEVIVIQDIHRHPELQLLNDAVRASKARGLISLPLREGGRVSGVLTLCAPDALRLSEDELGLLRELANDLAFGIAYLDSAAEQQRLQRSIRDQASLLDKAQDAILVRDLDHRISYWNQSCERLYGYTVAEALGASTLALLHRGDPAPVAAATALLLARGDWTGEITQFRKDGTPITVEARWNLVRDEAGEPRSILAINTDITARKQAEQAVHRALFHDPLTDLPNRQRFTTLLQDALARAQGSRRYGAVLFLNLDNFRTVNKTLGHRNGDALLRLVGQRLQEGLGPRQAAARVSGDEFLMLLEDIGEAEDAARAQALAEAQRLVDGLSAPAAIGEFELQVSACAGIAVYSPHDPEKADELLAQVDLALFHAKSAGKGSLRVFEPAFQVAVAKKAALETDLAQALARDQLALHYQPQLDRTGRMVGVEALLRWQHARDGAISPAVFIPIAEESGLILSIGQWVIDTACGTLARWAAMPHMAGISISVNVSAAQLRAQNFAERVGTAVGQAGVEARLLKLELTESILVDDIEGIIEKMNTIRAMGVGFSLDDFGTGYSSLAYLKQMPLDQLKIDQSFVRDILTDPNDAAIATTIITLAHSLGLRVIAEGVETDAQRDFLFAAECDGYQGYLFSRPIALADLERLAFARS